MIQIITAMSELGAGTRGASLGYAAIRSASLTAEPRFFRKYIPRKVETSNSLLFEHVNTPYGKRIKGIVRMYRRIAAKVAETLDDNRFPLVISGDHSNAGGTIAGLRQAYPTSRIGVVWIDAHGDLHSPYTSPSGNVHGMPLATAIGEDNRDRQINKPKPSTIKNWERLKGHPRRVQPSDIVFIALRDTEEPEDHLIAKHGMKVIRVPEVRQSGVQKAVEHALKHLEACELLYVSFDVDSMDPSISGGTGTPVKNGLTVQEATDLLLAFAQVPNLCCMEFTEINPLLDQQGNAMGEVAFSLLSKTVAQLEERPKTIPDLTTFQPPHE
jgi:arginase